MLMPYTLPLALRSGSLQRYFYLCCLLIAALRLLYPEARRISHQWCVEIWRCATIAQLAMLHNLQHANAHDLRESLHNVMRPSSNKAQLPRHCNVQKKDVGTHQANTAQNGTRTCTRDSCRNLRIFLFGLFCLSRGRDA